MSNTNFIAGDKVKVEGHEGVFTILKLNQSGRSVKLEGPIGKIQAFVSRLTPIQQTLATSSSGVTPAEYRRPAQEEIQKRLRELHAKYHGCESGELFFPEGHTIGHELTAPKGSIPTLSGYGLTHVFVDEMEPNYWPSEGAQSEASLPCSCPSLMKGHEPSCGWHKLEWTDEAVERRRLENVWAIPKPKGALSMAEISQFQFDHSSTADKIIYDEAGKAKGIKIKAAKVGGKK